MFVSAEEKKVRKLLPSCSHFRNNGKQIAIGGNTGVKFYDIGSGSLASEISDSGLSQVTAVKWGNSNSRMLLTASKTGSGNRFKNILSFLQGRENFQKMVGIRYNLIFSVRLIFFVENS